MNAGERYACAVLTETCDRLISEGKLRRLESYVFRMFISEAERCIGSPTADREKDVRRRLDMVGRALDVAEAVR